MNLEIYKVSRHHRPTCPGRRVLDRNPFRLFHIPIDELKEKLRFLAVTGLHAPLGQASHHLVGFLYVFTSPSMN